MKVLSLTYNILSLGIVQHRNITTMSIDALWSQANHTLTLIGQQKPSFENIKKLHDGYLSDLVTAIKGGTVPDRDSFRTFCGLNPLELKLVLTSELPESRYPIYHMSGPLNGVIRPKMIDLIRLPSDSWIHPDQKKSEKFQPYGYEILSTLIGFGSHDDCATRACKIATEGEFINFQAVPGDAINGHFGLRELEWISRNWKMLPLSFRKWAGRKHLVGWADVRFSKNRSYHVVPALSCNGVRCQRAPEIAWLSLRHKFPQSRVALRELPRLI